MSSRMHGFGWSHPLRRAWRKNTGRDSLLDVMWGVVLAVSMVGITWLGANSPTHLHYITPDQFRLLGVVMGAIALIGGIVMSRLDLDKDGFRSAHRRLEELLNTKIWSGVPSHDVLERMARMDLESLARDVYAFEEKVGAKSHQNDLYVARNWAREKFKTTHKFLLNLGLAEESWDSYFPKEGADAQSGSCS